MIRLIADSCTLINAGYVNPEITVDQHELTLQGTMALQNKPYLFVLGVMSNCINRPDCICPLREEMLALKNQNPLKPSIQE